MGQRDGPQLQKRGINDIIKASMKSFSELETVALDSNRGEINNKLRRSSKLALNGGLNHLLINEDTQEDERNQIRESYFYPSREKERSEQLRVQQETVEELKD